MLTQAGAKMSDLNSIEVHWTDAEHPAFPFRGYLERHITPHSHFTRTIMPARTVGDNWPTNTDGDGDRSMDAEEAEFEVTDDIYQLAHDRVVWEDHKKFRADLAAKR